MNKLRFPGVAGAAIALCVVGVGGASLRAASALPEIPVAAPRYDTLHAAAAAGRADEIARLLRRGLPPDALNDAKESPLHVAAAHGQAAAITALVAGGATVELGGGEDGRTPPLAMALRNDHGEAFQALLDAGADINRVQLCDAKTDCLRIMLDEGVDIETPDWQGFTALHWAARRNDVSAAKLLIERGADVNRASESGETPLIESAEQKGVEVAALLLEAGAAVDVPDLKGRTALERATRAGYVPAVKLLLGYGANPTRPDLSGRTPLELARDWDGGKRREVFEVLEARAAAMAREPAAMPDSLHDAALGNDVAAAQVLLTAGHNVAGQDSHGRTALHLAASGGMARLLLDAGAAVDAIDQEGSTPLMLAADANRLDVARVLLAAGADVTISDVDGFTAMLHINARKGEAMARLLLGAGAKATDASRHGNTPLRFAAAVGNLPLVELLIAHGASVNTMPCGTHTVLHNLAYTSGNHLRTMQALLAHQPDLLIRDSRGLTVMDLAVFNVDAKLVKLLSDAGAPLDFFGATVIGDVAAMQTFLDRDPSLATAPTPGNDPRTALHIAARSNNVDALTLLLEHGVPVDIRDHLDDTPLGNAAIEGAVEAIGLLIDRGAEIHHRNGYGSTPLMSAARFRKHKAVTALLARGAEPNLVHDLLRHRSLTPLHMAVKQGDVRSARALLEAGADPQVPDGAGVTPTNLAVRSGSRQIKALFAEYRVAEEGNR